MKFTVFGGKGFIGSKLSAKLQKEGHQVILPERDDNLQDLGDLGHIIYCVGLTSDFRTRTYDTIEAHICLWSRILQQCTFETCTYLSSTRVYLDSRNTNENTSLLITPSNADDLYNISKLAGESLCLKTGKGKVIRISNVIGKYNESSPGFINEITTMAKESNEITLETSMDSEKDYITVEDVVDLIPRIAVTGKKEIYNVASGKNLSHKRIIDILRKSLDFNVNLSKNAHSIRHSVIDISRIKEEFNFIPRDVIKYLSSS